jgi:hypothetical protein
MKIVCIFCFGDLRDTSVFFLDFVWLEPGFNFSILHFSFAPDRDSLILRN